MLVYVMSVAKFVHLIELMKTSLSWLNLAHWHPNVDEYALFPLFQTNKVKVEK